MKLDIMGLQFDNVTMDEASARAEQILAGKKTCYAVTPNAEIAYEALYDETLRALINGADLVLPDGAGVVLASKLLKTPLKQKVAGVDFADRLLSILEKTGGGLFLLGGLCGFCRLCRFLRRCGNLAHGRHVKGFHAVGKRRRRQYGNYHHCRKQ